MLHSFFFDTAERHPDETALWVQGESWSYSSVRRQALFIAASLRKHARGGRRCCALLGHRSIQAYSGVLGILHAGMTYVPLNPKFPPARNAAIIERAGCQVLIVDPSCEPVLQGVLPLLEGSLHILRPADLALHDSSLVGEVDAVVTRAEDIAYVLFTSGTTGVPKGVRITHSSAAAYVQGLLQSYPPAAQMVRHTQWFDLTFDLSVHDMFVCWALAGCLVIPTDADVLQPGEYIRRHAITHWFSVPSMASFMAQFRKLQPAAYPTLHVSMFCGEALPPALAEAWRKASPNSRVVNLYGPTEATIACAHFLYEGQDVLQSLAATPIGQPLPGQELVIVDEELNEVADGTIGELLLGGTQLSVGYISDNLLDHERFIERRFSNRKARRWYRTGDLARTTASWGVLFLGRLDAQVKLRGYRIELLEVEHVVRQAAQATQCAVIAWPLDAHGAPLGLVAFVAGSGAANATIFEACRAALPDYACPEKIIHIDMLPLNSNGKIDRRHLSQMLDLRPSTASLAEP